MLGVFFLINFLKACLIRLYWDWGLTGAITAAIGSVGNAIATGITAADALKETKKANELAQKQLDLENKRYDENIARQDAFLGEVNQSASLFDSPSKKKSITGLETLGTSTNTSASEPLPTQRI